MDILINKKYLIRAEQYTKFRRGFYEDANRYVFALPEWAGLPEGYTVYINAWMSWGRDEKDNLIAKEYFDLEENGMFRIPSDRNVEYVAIKTENREVGKKYKRYKFTAKELYALYQNVTLTDAATVVAKITIYSEYTPDRILEHELIIGERKDNWFYSENLKSKRRIGAKGVKILCKIRKDQIDDVQKFIDEHEKRKRQADNAMRAKQLDFEKIKILSFKIEGFYMSEELTARLDPIMKQVKDLKKDIELEYEELRSKAETIFSELCDEVKRYIKREDQTDEIRSDVSVSGNGERNRKGRKR